MYTGKGTWETFYRGMYTIMMEATGRDIPIFVRFGKDESEWKPYYLRPFNISIDVGDKLREPPIHVQPHICFQHLIRRHCTNCFYKVSEN